MRELKLTACLYFQFRPKTPPQNIHTTGMKFRANKTLLDIYERVKFVLSEGTDCSDDLAPCITQRCHLESVATVLIYEYVCIFKRFGKKCVNP